MTMERFQNELKTFINDLYGEEHKDLVFGEGDIGSSVMMIGEAPGEQETLLKRPFVGKAGKNLDQFLNLAELDRKSIYVTNTVKYRPTKYSKAGRIVNRPPTRNEIQLFLPWLMQEIELVKPNCIITLGNVPLVALTEAERKIGDVHGQLIDWNGRILFPMYHPASIIYNPSLKEVYHEDIMRFAAWNREQLLSRETDIKK